MHVPFFDLKVTDPQVKEELLDSVARVLDHGRDGEIGYWKNPNKPVAIATKAVSTNGDCREFVTKVTVKGEARQVRGTACKRNGEWEVKEMY